MFSNKPRRIKKKIWTKKQEVEGSQESQEPEEKIKVTIEELRQAYDGTLPQERIKETRKFRQIYESIHEITNQRTNLEKKEHDEVKEDKGEER